MSLQDKHRWRGTSFPGSPRETLGTSLRGREWSRHRVHRALRVVFKWLSKAIPWLRLLRLVIGLKDSRQFFNQWEAKPKPIAPCTRDLSRASSELHVIARNCDWFIALPAPAVIGRSNCFGFGFCSCFGFGFSTVFWKTALSRRSSVRFCQSSVFSVFFFFFFFFFSFSLSLS